MNCFRWTPFAGALSLCALFTLPVSAAMINEIRIDQGGTDNQEYFELSGTPGESLNTLTYLVFGDGTGGSGVIEAVASLAGFSIPADGYFLAAESTWDPAPTGFPGGSVDATLSLNFENSDNVTHMLVSGFSGTNGSDLDTNDDGVFDSTPWTAIIDSVALLTSAASELTYSSTTVGPDGTFVPGHVFRIPDNSGAWQIGDFDGDPAFQDTPGRANIPEPTSLVLSGLALCGLLAVGRLRRA